ncbi:MAG: alginate lyase family protein [Deltaproteobacteria bacterium]|nr:alginate lyase family protein [Deltaproteobacteria bacterium]
MPVAKAESLLSQNRFRFLNKEREIVSKSEWNNPSLEKLWLYNLHYFDFLNSGHGPNRTLTCSEIINRWITENPPFEGVGWEPYPTSRRIVNWIKWAWSGGHLWKEAINSLFLQAMYLTKRLEWHLLGNHLLANAKALIYAGLFFDGQEPEIWLRKGISIFLREIDEQILGDGGHFERSPMYHAIVLEDVLDVINALKYSGNLNFGPAKSLYDKCLEIAPRMLFWLGVMTHPDGKPVLFNDSTFDGAASKSDLESYASKLGIEVKNGTAAKYINEDYIKITHLKETGYIRVDWDKKSAFLDVAPLGPDYLLGHGHADTLTFELSDSSERIIVDTGVSTYEPNMERQRQRSTAAHNTVVVNEQDSSEVWAAFRVGRRAYPFGLSIVKKKDGSILIECQHTGYERLNGRPIHKRQWRFLKGGFIVKDTVIGRFKRATAFLHFHPSFRLNSTGLRSIEAICGSKKGILIEVTKGEPQIINTTWHPEFGSAVESRGIQVQLKGNECEVGFFFRE